MYEELCMKNGKLISLLIGTFLLLVVVIVTNSNRSSLAQAETTPPPEQTNELTPEVTEPATVLPLSATPVPVEVIVTTPTLDPNLLILTATAVAITPGGVQVVPPGQALISPSSSVPQPYSPLGVLETHPAVANIPVRIAYIIASDALPVDNIVSATAASEVMLNYPFVEFNIANTWEEIRRLDATSPIEGIIIHRSMYANSDLEWTAAAARRGVAFALINMHDAELTELWNDNCARQHPINNPFERQQGDYFYTSVLAFLSDNPEDQVLAYQATFDICDMNILYQSGREIQMVNDAHHNLLLSPSGVGGINYVYNTLIGHVLAVRVSRYNFINRHLNPTAASPTIPPVLELLIPTARP